ncbi:MAG: hypothetical protein HYS80_00920 [Candidatus Aenigmarchaeota archaeon]|nr:hypothetical protein [Candidatus Aenigmarchaeota archaeon]
MITVPLNHFDRLWDIALPIEETVIYQQSLCISNIESRIYWSTAFDVKGRTNAYLLMKQPDSKNRWIIKLTGIKEN